MSDRFDLHLRYPELFEPLTEEQRRNVMQPLASSWLEGDNPTREDVALLIDYELGRITAEEYDRQALAKALAYQTRTSQNAGSQNVDQQGVEEGE
ncbi:alpha-mannosidase [Rothia mucilaginosa]|uniref:antitoxin VbhA family protein n=1 Tax=Rothia mucilaginosa TaxID=43675 RepID=UPI0028E96412|nr:alpha-mannosidase [Rothia mucilaginosa]